MHVQYQRYNEASFAYAVQLDTLTLTQLRLQRRQSLFGSSHRNRFEQPSARIELPGPIAHCRKAGLPVAIRDSGKNLESEGLQPLKYSNNIKIHITSTY